ncbi:transcriptional regulator [Streptomyces griseomycini]|uniref:IclR family transcriptional regulator domain-containing protein n=1 Tax=Streptomyces griseomycini TaxID=66895 RepID=UPI001874E489|nr:IclR family transcriptional regulator C-terminal domain-containing protein [Streptomyces griseomycini]GGQ11771.1 transcriptional regulator [Streptomyces griseomycini]
MPAHTPRDARQQAEPPAEAVTPLLRGIAVLRRLTEAASGTDAPDDTYGTHGAHVTHGAHATDGTLSLSALQRATDLPRSTVDRITSTLAHMGYVRVDGRDVTLAPRLMELGNAYLAALRLPALLSARAEALADELDESVSLAVADRDGIRFIHQATRRRALSLSFRIGDLLPAERTAPGPLFAAEWAPQEWRAWRARRAADPRDRSFPALPPREHPAPDPDFEHRAEAAARTGWSLDDQLIEPGLVAVSVPVRDPRTGRTVCAASVVSHTSRRTAQDLRDALLPRLRAAVTDMEHALRTAPLPAPYPAAPSGLALWTGASKQELGRDFVESLARGLTVLTAFGEGRAELTLTEVAKATGLARATARRALITYEHEGLVTSREGRFTPTPRVLSLGFPPLSRITLPRIAEPHLAALAHRVHESASLAVLVDGGTKVQYTARATTPRVMSIDITVGTRLPAYATSLGRVLLADLPEQDRAAADLRPLTPHTLTDPATLTRALDRVRAEGYALVDQEWEEGLRAIAVPVRDRAGRVVAAVDAATHVARRSVEECTELILPALRETATRIEADLHTASRFTRVPSA